MYIFLFILHKQVCTFPKYFFNHVKYKYVTHEYIIRQKFLQRVSLFCIKIHKEMVEKSKAKN